MSSNSRTDARATKKPLGLVLCEALGINPDSCRRIVIDCDAMDSFLNVTVYSRPANVCSVDEIVETLTQYELRPIKAEGQPGGPAGVDA